MRTILLLILIAILLIAAAFIALDPGRLELEWRGWTVETPAAVAAGVLLLIFAAGLFVFESVRRLTRAPKHVRDMLERRKRDAREEAFLDGLAAMASGDARTLARSAELMREGGRERVADVFDAAGARIRGDKNALTQALRRLSEDEEAAMIGLRGLLAEALERGDHAGACATAERAFARAPQAEWAFRSFLRLSAEAGRWDDVLRVLDDGSRRGFVAHASAARVAALLARSGARRRMGERERADEDVLEAAKLDFLGPAAMSEAAKVWIARGKAKKAEKMLAEAWRISPHPALAEAYDLCAPNAGRETRAERLIALSKSAPDADESRLLRATQFASLHRWSDARDALEPLLESPRPGRRAYRVMADLTLGESGDIDAARAWYDRALGAPADDDLQGWRPGVGFDLGGLGGLRLFLEAAGLAPSAAAREGWSDDVGGAGASGLLEARGEGSGHALVPRDAH